MYNPEILLLTVLFHIKIHSLPTITYTNVYYDRIGFGVMILKCCKEEGEKEPRGRGRGEEGRTGTDKPPWQAENVWRDGQGDAEEGGAMHAPARQRLQAPHSKAGNQGIGALGNHTTGQVFPGGWTEQQWAFAIWRRKAGWKA